MLPLTNLRMATRYPSPVSNSGEAMTRSELITQLAAENPHLRHSDVEAIVTTIFEEITSTLSDGRRVELRGFGAFSVKRRDPRTGRNPRTGEAVDVSGKAVPFFKPGKELRETVNGGPPQAGAPPVAKKPAAKTKA